MKNAAGKKSGGLSVSSLSYSYGARHALKNVTFDAAPGRFTALLGPNGAGKTTLFSLLTRLFAAPSGQISIAGIDVEQHPIQALSRLGVVFQQPTLDLDLTVRANMRYFAGLHGLSRAESAGRIDKALARLDMSERIDERVRDLNGGHRRRMEIARALLHQPDVLLFDEPTVGLDTATRREIVDHVHELANAGACVLWATHLVDEVRTDDALVILHQGEVLVAADAHDVAGSRSLESVFVDITRAQTGEPT